MKLSLKSQMKFGRWFACDEQAKFSQFNTKCLHTTSITARCLYLRNVKSLLRSKDVIFERLTWWQLAAPSSASLSWRHRGTVPRRPDSLVLPAWRQKHRHMYRRSLPLSWATTVSAVTADECAPRSVNSQWRDISLVLFERRNTRAFDKSVTIKQKKTTTTRKRADYVFWPWQHNYDCFKSAFQCSKWI